MVNGMEEDLRDFLATGKNWETIKTTTPGVFIVRAPETKSRPAILAIEINPPDSSGNPTKRRGLKIWNKAELEIFRKLLSMEKLDEIIVTVERICPPSSTEERILDI